MKNNAIKWISFYFQFFSQQHEQYEDISLETALQTATKCLYYRLATHSAVIFVTFVHHIKHYVTTIPLKNKLRQTSNIYSFLFLAGYWMLFVCACIFVCFVVVFFICLFVQSEHFFHVIEHLFKKAVFQIVFHLVEIKKQKKLVFRQRYYFMNSMYT